MLRKRLNDCRRVLSLMAAIAIVAGWCSPTPADDDAASTEWPKQIQVPELRSSCTSRRSRSSPPIS